MATHCSLPRLMQILPQELYDKVYDLTFTAQPAARYVGTKPLEHGHAYAFDEYKKTADGFVSLWGLHAEPASHVGLGKHGLFKAPDSIALLHIDRASRWQFAASFFRGEGIVFYAQNSLAMLSFVKSLQRSHAKRIEGFWEVEDVEIFWPKFEKQMIAKGSIPRSKLSDLSKGELGCGVALLRPGATSWL